ncbi:probable G-protein coupled receptor 139 isoform X2 [Chiloscyllium plagiosum]|uniref:probable G-protein coupled receptor 139 isoform X2 n=1 Tax=Chiloscyllium plagiosum TaxID=36176 RepID=UPI001CB7B3C9|nr:probable G-protein coupled receptor 139 isoform X2 [Chiloscyllium plagiosum]
MNAANILSIVILSRRNCGLSRCITHYLASMAIADLLVLIFEVIMRMVKDIYFPKSFLDYTSTCRLTFAFSVMSIDCSVWLTVAFSFDRSVSICCQTLRVKYCTEKTSAVVIAIVCGLCAVKCLPVYFVNQPGIIIDSMAWFCVIKSDLYILPVWKAYLCFDTILTPFAAFLFISLFNALTIRHILTSSKVRRSFREKNNDSELENRRKSIILLLSISGSFIFLWMLIPICYVYAEFTENQFYQTDYNDPFTVMEQTGYMLQLLSSCTNTFIYAVAQTKFRNEVKNVITCQNNQKIQKW